MRTGSPRRSTRWKRYSQRDFPAVPLLNLRYDTEVEERFENEITTYQAERGQELIILLSDFQTDENGGDGSLEPNATYTDWQWELVWGDGGWTVLNQGYA